MPGIRAFLTDEHRACDQSFVAMEEALSSGDPEQARSSCAGFVAEMERHFRREEDVLFPRFETATGMREGPTRVMRREHDEMRGLMRDLAEAVDRGDRDTGLGIAETLLIMIQQHNLKEEQVLYPMAESHLTAQSDEILDRMARLEI
jgi:hemerythrin-like domain-containing protein